jgi:hypothetical protein
MSPTLTKVLLQLGQDQHPQQLIQSQLIQPTLYLIQPVQAPQLVHYGLPVVRALRVMYMPATSSIPMDQLFQVLVQ